MLRKLWRPCHSFSFLFPLSKCSRERYGTMNKICESKKWVDSVEMASDPGSWAPCASVSSPAKWRGGANLPAWPTSPQEKLSIHLGKASWRKSQSEREERGFLQNQSYFFVDQKDFYAKSISNEFKTEQKWIWNA